jgi:hypothetical protein
MRKLVAIAAVFCFGLAGASADEFNVAVKKIDGNKIIGSKLPKKGAEDPKLEDVTLTASDTVKVTKKATAKGKDPEAIEKGLKDAIFTKGMVICKITTEKDTVTEVQVLSDPNKYQGTIKKIDGNKITLVKKSLLGKLDPNPKGEEVTVTVGATCKFVSIKAPEKKGDKAEKVTLEKGLKDEAFSGTDVIVQITIGDDNTPIEVRVLPAPKKKDA